MKKATLFLTVMLLFSLLLSPFKHVLGGSTADELKKEQEAAKFFEDQLKADKAQKEAINQKQSIAQTELNKIELKMVKLQNQIDQLISKIEKIKQEYLELNAEMDALKASIEEKNTRMKKLLKVLYQNYTLSFNAYLFTSKSINEIIDKAVYVQYLFEADKTFFRSLKEEKKQLETKKQNQVEIEIKLQTDKAELDKENAQYRELEYQKSVQINNFIYEGVLTDISIAADIRSLDEAKQKIKVLLQRLKKEEQRKKLLNTKLGPVMWPIPGPISSPFGMRIHPIFRVYRLHTGVDIDAESGTPIHSFTKGVVVYADWLSGYGKTVVIQHTADISSLYAHMRTIYVKEGQKVELDNVIGEVGTTGWSTEPHLHFEIMFDGEAIDPLKFLTPP